VPVLFALTLPWSGWLLIHLRRSRRLDAARPGLVSLMLVWLVVVVCFFSVPQSKLVG
jgi:4-amino-4-deoxy-L-arabinose transferase-like glycosyltransferase